MVHLMSRRGLLGRAAGLLGAAAASGAGAGTGLGTYRGKAQIAITLDLEMSRNFPQWETTHWDYEKGNLNEETKRYSVEAARRVKAAGGLLHFFVVGRVLEQADVSWLREISEAGHPIGNHTYDHVNVLAGRVEDLQFRFQRSPWLLRGMSVQEAIRENIRLAGEAMKSRLGIEAAGFRTPGGFHGGLREHPGIRSMLQELGFGWVSSLYPSHPNTQPMEEPSGAVLQGIVEAQKQAQPFVYDDGLVEIPMSPISDIGAFRGGRWKLEWFLRSVRECVEWTIETGGVFDFLAHPSCLYVVDPEFRAIDLICELVGGSGGRAELVDLGAIAARVRGGWIVFSIQFSVFSIQFSVFSLEGRERGLGAGCLGSLRCRFGGRECLCWPMFLGCVAPSPPSPLPRWGRGGDLLSLGGVIGRCCDGLVAWICGGCCLVLRECGVSGGFWG